MTHPFIKRLANKSFLKLHRDLYPKDLIEKIRKEDAESVTSFKAQGKYHLLALSGAAPQDYLEFLNYLIFSQNER